MVQFYLSSVRACVRVHRQMMMAIFATCCANPSEARRLPAALPAMVEGIDRVCHGLSNTDVLPSMVDEKGTCHLWTTSSETNY